MPEVKLTDDNFDENGQIDAISLGFSTGLYSSRSDARRTIQQGGVSVNKEKITIDDKFEKKLFEDEVIYQSGKKKFVKVIL